MSIDLSQFFEVFFEESFEGLDVMEAELLALTPGTHDLETINTIFRAAHSIKGGSGTFGFTVVSNFTHVLETLLDQIRDGRRALEQQHIDLLLLSVDCLRDLLSALKAEEVPDEAVANKLKADFESILADGVCGEYAANESEDKPSSTQSSGWAIKFFPFPYLFKTGNEPLYMLHELEALGKLTITADLSHIPEFSKLVPDECHVGWDIELHGNIEKEQIEEIFEWVLDDCDFSLNPIGEATPSAEVEDTKEESEPSIEPPAQVSEEKKETKPTPTQAAKAPSAVKKGETNSIRVAIDKVDSLINMVGELVITQAMLCQLAEREFDENNVNMLQEGLAQLSHNTRDLQESVMRIRMLPISFVFSRFPRLVRDISQKLNKKVELKLIGEQTELDKTVMEKLSDPMVHLVRNSLDHGLESPEARVAAGKDETGSVTLNAFHQGGNIVIEIIDDGAGLNSEKIRAKAIENHIISENEELSESEVHDLIFRPGFSTADEVSDISGRGVGMDVVRRNIQELNGSIEVNSVAGEGSTFRIRLPLTLAILDGQLVRVADHTYIIPLISIIESLQVDIEKVNNVGGSVEVLRLRDEYIPILRLYQLFKHENAITELEHGLLVVVETDNEKVGLLVDDLLAQQQVVIKSLENNYQRIEGISGATILGDGRVSLIVDIAGLIKLAGLKKPGKQGLSIDSLIQEMA